MSELYFLFVEFFEKLSSLLLGWLDNGLVRFFGLDKNQVFIVNTILTLFCLIVIAVRIVLFVRKLLAEGMSWQAILIRSVLFLLALILGISLIVRYIPSKEPPVHLSQPSAVYYETGDYTYSQAQLDCQAKGGYLVTFSSKEEFRQLTSQIPEYLRKYQLYVGAMREPGGTHYYCHKNYQTYGDPIDQIPGIWHPGEPSFIDRGLDLEEFYVAIYWSPSQQEWLCNDVSDSFLMETHDFDGCIGYLYYMD